MIGVDVNETDHKPKVADRKPAHAGRLDLLEPARERSHTPVELDFVFWHAARFAPFVTKSIHTRDVRNLAGPQKDLGTLTGVTAYLNRVRAHWQ
jgi:hypothetical protein